MKYFSETLKKTFDTEKACLEAEATYNTELQKKEAEKKQLAETRKARAKEVEDAYRAIIEAQKNYNKLRQAFIDDYHSFHMTFSSKDDIFNWDFMDNFWKIF